MSYRVLRLKNFKFNIAKTFSTKTQRFSESLLLAPGSFTFAYQGEGEKTSFVCFKEVFIMQQT